jgi:hypothetical protein
MKRWVSTGILLLMAASLSVGRVHAQSSWCDQVPEDPHCAYEGQDQDCAELEQGHCPQFATPPVYTPPVPGRRPASSYSLNYRLVVDGNEIPVLAELEPKLDVRSQRLLVPVRTLAEALDGDVSWSDKGEVIFGHYDRTGYRYVSVSMFPLTESPVMRVTRLLEPHGAIDTTTNYRIDLAPYIINGHTFVPLRFLPDALDMDVETATTSDGVKVITISTQLSCRVVEDVFAKVQSFHPQVKYVTRWMFASDEPEWPMYPCTRKAYDAQLYAFASILDSADLNKVSITKTNDYVQVKSLSGVGERDEYFAILAPDRAQVTLNTVAATLYAQRVEAADNVRDKGFQAVGSFLGFSAPIAKLGQVGKVALGIAGLAAGHSISGALKGIPQAVRNCVEVANQEQRAWTKYITITYWGWGRMSCLSGPAYVPIPLDILHATVVSNAWSPF